MDARIENQALLADHIRDRLSRRADSIHFPAFTGKTVKAAASVLFLLGTHPPSPDQPPETCLIFNQRSRLVRQPGDLCFPGGGIAPQLDRLLSILLICPGLPLFRYLVETLHRNRFVWPGRMSLLLATSLRESYEEMRLNPLRLNFLGPLAPQRLSRFQRIIYPMCAWTNPPHRFSPNWEVERIVTIPLRHFLQPEAYGRFRIPSHDVEASAKPLPESTREVPCVIYHKGPQKEILWGVTYNIVMNFLKVVFDFRPPDTESLPIVSEMPKEARSPSTPDEKGAAEINFQHHAKNGHAQ